jgi:Uma2 family endonuclease
VTETARKSWTYADLIAAGMDPERWEIADGEPVEVGDMGFGDSVVFARVAQAFAPLQDLAVVCVEGRFLLREEPRVERKPDVAVVLAERVPHPMPLEIFHGAPDLVVEVLSFTDSTAEKRVRAGQFLDCGAREVWIVDPALECVTVLRPGERPRPVGVGGEVTTPFLPGFALQVGELFPG